MKLGLCLVASALLAGSAMASTSCSNADGSLVYVDSQYEGGAPPPPGMLQGKQTWTYKGQVIAHAEQYVGGPFNQIDLTATEVPGSKVMVKKDSNAGAQFEEYYAHQATLARSQGGAVLPDRGDTTVTDYFFCHTLVRYLP